MKNQFQVRVIFLVLTALIGTFQTYKASGATLEDPWLNDEIQMKAPKGIGRSCYLDVDKHARYENFLYVPCNSDRDYRVFIYQIDQNKNTLSEPAIIVTHTAFVQSFFQKTGTLYLFEYGNAGPNGRLLKLKLSNEWFSRLKVENDYRVFDETELVEVAKNLLLNEFADKVGIISNDRFIVFFNKFTKRVFVFDTASENISSSVLTDTCGTYSNFTQNGNCLVCSDYGQYYRGTSAINVTSLKTVNVSEMLYKAGIGHPGELSFAHIWQGSKIGFSFQRDSPSERKYVFVDLDDLDKKLVLSPPFPDMTAGPKYDPITKRVYYSIETSDSSKTKKVASLFSLDPTTYAISEVVRSQLGLKWEFFCTTENCPGVVAIYGKYLEAIRDYVPYYYSSQTREELPLFSGSAMAPVSAVVNLSDGGIYGYFKNGSGAQSYVFDLRSRALLQYPHPFQNGFGPKDIFDMVPKLIVINSTDEIWLEGTVANHYYQPGGQSGYCTWSARNIAGNTETLLASGSCGSQRRLAVAFARDDFYLNANKESRLFWNTTNSFYFLKNK